MNCPSCGQPATGKFCNQCGISLAPPPASAPVATFAPWMAFAAVAIAVLAFLGGRLSTQGSTPSGSGTPLTADVGAPANGTGAAPDISSMSPRERAARLYDRVMRYEEEQKLDSVKVFAPMALEAYRMLGTEFDTDARYDFGRIAAASGEYAIADAAADTIISQFPNHLLALALRARTAGARGRSAEAAKVWKDFLTAKPAELKKDYPEYKNHAGDIEAATRIATGKP